jgi:hypothetical protein
MVLIILARVVQRALIDLVKINVITLVILSHDPDTQFHL